MVQRLNPKNPINPRNFAHKFAQMRHDELEKGRQVSQQNALQVNSPPIIYYQQVKNGFTCTCHASQEPLDIEEVVAKVDPALASNPDPNNTQLYEVDLKTPLFGSTIYKNEHIEQSTEVFDDEEDNLPNAQPLFPDLFAKGTDCGICNRTGFVPLWYPVGRQRQVFTTHKVKALEGYSIERAITPHIIHRMRNNGSYVEFELEVPLYFRGCFYGIFQNNKRAGFGRIMIESGEPLLLKHLVANKGKVLKIRIKDCDFTHVVFEFDFGAVIKANFPQFSVSRDYSYFFNLQSISIELPATISNAQIGDIVVVPEWNRMWSVYSVNPYYDMTTLIKTSVEGRIINNIETMASMAKLTELTDLEAMPQQDEFIPIINKIFA